MPAKKILAITGRYDPTFWPELTERFLAEVAGNSVKFEHLCLPCGHYSLGVPPFSQIAGYRFGAFLRRALQESGENDTGVLENGKGIDQGTSDE